MLKILNTAVVYFIHLTVEEDVLTDKSAHEDILPSSIILYIFNLNMKLLFLLLFIL